MKLNRIERAFIAASVIVGIPALFCDVVVIIMVITGTKVWP